MCQNTQDEFVLDKLSQDFKKLRKCLKCASNSTIITRVNEALCKPCFMEYFTHKFRATIGKNRLFDPFERVLFAYSGSASSVAMLHLIKQGTGEEAKKKFLFKPIVLFIEESSINEDYLNFEKRIGNLNKIRESVEYSGFQIVYSLIENNLLLGSAERPIFYESIDKIEFNNELSDKFNCLFKTTTTLTSKEELVKRLKMNLINEIGVKLGVKKLILAIDCTKLTIQLLSNIANGKAAHLSSELNLKDSHDERIHILKPLRELTSKEIAYYNFNIAREVVNYDFISSLTPQNSTIYRLTEKFIVGLQSNYPTTVYTLFRASDKFTNPGEMELDDELVNENLLCQLCNYKIDTKLNHDGKNTLSDVQFSQDLMQLKDENSKKIDVENENFKERLCYSCRLILRDNVNPKMFEKVIKEKKEENLKNKIKDYLLE